MIRTMLMENVRKKQDDRQDDKPGVPSKTKNMCVEKGYHPALAG